MQGVLYFPYIAVPNSVWLTRTLLYWDSVATIVPHSIAHDPDDLDPYTRSLVQAELVHQTLPEEISSKSRLRFATFLEGLSDDEIERRRENFELGASSRVHRGKFVEMMGLEYMRDLGLANVNYPQSWVLIETTTANEFMAALALALCNDDSGFVRGVAGRDLSEPGFPSPISQLLSMP